MLHINDLPIEILSRIFDCLNVYDRKQLSCVCTLWYDILHCVHFQRQCRLVIDNTFEEELSDLEQRILRSCRNLSITHWYDMDDDFFEDEDEETAERQTDDVVRIKYLFEPSPELILSNLLFNEKLDLESLDLNSTFGSCRSIIEDRLTQMEQLCELGLSFDQDNNPDQPTPDPSVWVIKHNRLRKLRIGLSYQIDAFKIEAPSLTSLDIHPKCRWSMAIVETYCRQLEYLKLLFHDVEYMESFLSLPFPNLKHLKVRMFDDKEAQIRYARSRNRISNAERDEQFVKDIPRLKKMVLESNMMFFRIGALLAKSNHQLEELMLEEQNMDYEQLKVVEMLPKLKSLTLFRCKVLMPSPMLPALHMPNLDKLSLFYNESSIAFNAGLAGLKYLKVSLSWDRNHKVMYKICNNLPNLENLEVISNNKLVNTCLRHMGRLTKLRTLKLDSCELKIRHWMHCPVVPSVHRLGFYNCTLSYDTLQPIAKIFPNLRELFIDRCYFKRRANDRKDESDSDKEEGDDTYLNADNVRHMFPQCRVSCIE